jgi:hypothetical protein
VEVLEMMRQCWQIRQMTKMPEIQMLVNEGEEGAANAISSNIFDSIEVESIKAAEAATLSRYNGPHDAIE